MRVDVVRRHASGRGLRAIARTYLVRSDEGTYDGGVDAAPEPHTDQDTYLIRADAAPSGGD